MSDKVLEDAECYCGYRPRIRAGRRWRAARWCRSRGAARRRAPRARCAWGRRAGPAAGARRPSRGTRARSAPRPGTPGCSSHRQNALCTECSASSLCNCCSPGTAPASSPPESSPSSTTRPPPAPLPVSLLWTASPTVYPSTSFCPLNTVPHTTLNRPAHAFRGVTVAEFQISTLAMHFRLFGPGLVAFRARKHNTGAGPQWTKGYPFAIVNFARELTANDLNWRGSDENWRAACGAGRPAGERDRRHRLSLICFDTQLFAREWRGARRYACARGTGLLVFAFGGARMGSGVFGIVRTLFRAGGGAGFPPTGDIEARFARTWSANGIAQRTSVPARC